MNRLGTVALTGFLAVCLIDARSAMSQQTSPSRSAQARTSVIVASFNKSKHAVKERYGVRVEKYKEVRSSPAIKENVREYAGSYEVQGLGFSFELRVDAKGNVAATGYEPVDVDGAVRRRFTLRNARIEGALLTASKVYESGASEPFEGVFINLTSFDSPTDTGVTTFGLGVVGRSRALAQGVYVDRLFYQKK